MLLLRRFYHCYDKTTLLGFSRHNATSEVRAASRGEVTRHFYVPRKVMPSQRFHLPFNLARTCVAATKEYNTKEPHRMEYKDPFPTLSSLHVFLSRGSRSLVQCNTESELVLFFISEFTSRRLRGYSSLEF